MNNSLNRFPESLWQLTLHAVDRICRNPTATSIATTLLPPATSSAIPVHSFVPTSKAVHVSSLPDLGKLLLVLERLSPIKIHLDGWMSSPASGRPSGFSSVPPLARAGRGEVCQPTLRGLLCWEAGWQCGLFHPGPTRPGAPTEPVRASAQLALLSHPAWNLITSCYHVMQTIILPITVSVITFMAWCHVLWSAYLPPPAHAGIDPKSTKLVGISGIFWIFFKSSFCILFMFCSLYWFMLCPSSATFSWLAIERQLNLLSLHLSVLCYTSQLLPTISCIPLIATVLWQQNGRNNKDNAS